MSLLLAKIVVSVCLVLGLSWVAEKVNPRIAGILSGMPLGAVLVLFFVGLDLGPEFATKSALYAIPSITSTIAFSIGYYFTSRLNTKFAPLFSSVVGIICYLTIALILNEIDFNLSSGIIITLITLIIVGYAFRSQESNKIQATWKICPTSTMVVVKNIDSVIQEISNCPLRKTQSSDRLKQIMQQKLSRVDENCFRKIWAETPLGPRQACFFPGD